MRTKTIEVYEFSELSESAQTTASINLQGSVDYFGASDNEDTLRAFENIFPVRVGRWEYGSYGGDYINFEFTESDEIAELSGIRLLKYLHNNYYNKIFKGKYYSKGQFVNGQYTYKHRYSRVQKENCCVLTGYCLDDDILQPIYDFLKKPSEYVTFKELLYDCLQSWLIAARTDYEGFYSLESMADFAEANNYEFDKNGDFI